MCATIEKIRMRCIFVFFFGGGTSRSTLVSLDALLSRGALLSHGALLSRGAGLWHGMLLWRGALLSRGALLTRRTNAAALRAFLRAFGAQSGKKNPVGGQGGISISVEYKADRGRN